MTKKEIHEEFVGLMTAELKVISDAAKQQLATATDNEHQAKSKYETFGLESSYLARGQAKRAAELKDALERFQVLPLKELNDSTPIQLSALVKLESADLSKRTLFIGPAAGGDKISVDGEEIVIITSQSPMGRALLGKKVGDCFDISLGRDAQTFTVMSVE